MYLYDAKGQRVENILRTETLDADLQAFGKKYGLDIPERKRVETPGKERPSGYNLAADLVSAIETFYADDFELLNSLPPYSASN
eukprot:scaffold7351_cov259-Pinguiococcus_pyrenoidosus.AAC.21